MKRTRLSLLAALTLALAGGALAGGGLPQLATVQVGPYPVSLHNDSQTAVTGANTFYLEAEGLKPGAWLELSFHGPQGQHLTVPLTRVASLGGSDHSHGGTSSSASHSTSTSGHSATDSAHSTTASDPMAGMPGMEGMDHSAPASDPMAGMDHGSGAAAPAAPTAPEAEPVLSAADQERKDYAFLHHHDNPYVGRGKASLPAEGEWMAVVTIREPGGYNATGSAVVEASYGGPSRLYVGASGLIVFSSLLYGVIGRRKNPRPEGRGARGAR